MTNLETILQKKYHEKVVKLPEYKKKIGIYQEFLKEYKITCNPKDDVSYFQLEVLYESIYNKKCIEGAFFKAYLEMQDFWNDLDYQKRNQLVQVDMKQKCEKLKHFEYQQQTIYIPVFDLHLNHIYADEIVSLEMKKYRLLKNEFNLQIEKDIYGSYPYRHQFSSCEFIAETIDGYCLYFSKLNRFYYIGYAGCIKTLNLDPKCIALLDDDLKKLIAMLFMEMKEKAIAECILKYQLVDVKMQKKVQRYLHKINV